MYGFIRIYDWTRYLTFFAPENCNAIHNRIRYVICLKSGTIDIFSHYCEKIKVGSYYSLPIEKRLI